MVSGLPTPGCHALFSLLFFAVQPAVPDFQFSSAGVVNAIQASLAFFLVLNFLICLWEITLCFRIKLIHQKYLTYKEKYKGKQMQVPISPFNRFCFVGDVTPAHRPEEMRNRKFE
jgi:hypothetical protein